MASCLPSETHLLPETPGVYRMIGPEELLLYIGKALHLRARVSSYFEERSQDPRIVRMASQIERIDTIETSTEQDALVLEQKLIAKDKPKYNIIFRDDKTYAYLLISDQEIPKLSFYRGERSAAKGRLFGPYTDGKIARIALEFAQKTFRIRTCPDSSLSNRSRPCVLHQIQRCPAPCVFPDAIAPHKSQALAAARFLQGDTKSVLAELQTRMDEAANSLSFEKAAFFRDQIKALSAAVSPQHIESRRSGDVDAFFVERSGHEGALCLLEARGGVIRSCVTSHFCAPEEGIDDPLSAFIERHYAQHPAPAKIILSQIPSAPLPPGSQWETQPSGAEKNWLEMAQNNAQGALRQAMRRERSRFERQADLEKTFSVAPGAFSSIDCFDISHFQGESPVAACVRYAQGLMDKKRYRLINIPQSLAANDPASIKEALIRRYQNVPPEELPHLLLIDGGPAQLGAAQEALTFLGAQTPLLGISKGPERKPGDEELHPVGALCAALSAPPPLLLGKSSPALALLQEIRDEAHRFCISRNRKSVSKKRSASVLLSVPGIGPSRRRALLARFGDIAGLSRAGVSDLSSVPGVSQKLAERILQWLSENYR